MLNVYREQSSEFVCAIEFDIDLWKHEISENSNNIKRAKLMREKNARVEDGEDLNSENSNSNSDQEGKTDRQ